MRNLKRTLLFTLAAALVSILAAQQASISAVAKPSIQPPSEAYRFPNGQTLHYDAEWRLFKAGQGTLRIEASTSSQPPKPPAPWPSSIACRIASSPTSTTKACAPSAS